MAAPIRISNPLSVRGEVECVLILGEGAFSEACLRAARRLLPASAVYAVSDLTASLVEYSPTLVIHTPENHVREGATAEPLNTGTDLKVRSAGALLVPVLVTRSELTVGPVFGSGRSCAACWKARHAQRAQPQKAVPVQEDATKLTLATLASIALGSTLALLSRNSAPFTSHYLLYDLRSRQLRHGTLTSMHTCQTCREWFRSRERSNSSLEALITQHFKGEGRADSA